MARIVIVDDNLLVRSLLRDILNDGGHAVVGEAKDGMEAPGQVRDLRPDLVTLDLVMPGRSGLPTLKHLMMLDHSLPVVVCSAFLNENHVLTALRLGAKGFIVKPFDRESVLSAVGGALGGSGVVEPALASAAADLPSTADDPLAGKREYLRTDAFLRVILQAEHSVNFIDTSTINLSGSGMLLAEDCLAVAAQVGLRLYLGTHVGFRLYLGENEPPIDGRARVVRIAEDRCLALAFEQIAVAEHERLVVYVREHELTALV
ncbi:MAG: response regulator [Solirubrobacteraceae bacterium]